MARHLTPAEIRDALTTWLVPVIYEPGWETRGNGGSWGDVGFLLMHHTGDDLPDNVSKNMLRDGRPGLSGPLCNFAPRDDGRLHVIAAGPANHAGTGDPRVLAAVRAESYGAAPPAPRYSQGQAGGIGGNSLSMGWESMYAGPKDPTINPLQYRVAVLSQAAISWKFTQVSGDHWTGKSTLGHKEWQRGKPDPAGIVMATQRADIDWCLAHGPAPARRWYDTGLRSAPAGSGGSAPTPPSSGASGSGGVTVKDELEMATEQEVKQWLREVLAEEATAREGWTGHRIVKDVRAADPAGAPRVAPSTLLEDTAATVRAIAKKVGL